MTYTHVVRNEEGEILGTETHYEPDYADAVDEYERRLEAEGFADYDECFECGVIVTEDQTYCEDCETEIAEIERKEALTDGYAT